MAEKMATRDGYGKALVELGKKRPDIVVFDADLAKSTRTEWFKKEFPERFFDMGIAEQNMMGFAAGMAASGKTVFASSFAIFASGRAWEQIRQSHCLADLNVKVAATHAGVSVGQDGASHQAIEDIALMRCIPHMRVIVPCDGPEAFRATLAAADSVGPLYLRLGRASFPNLTDDKTPFQIGKANVMREGNSVTLIACGQMVIESMKAAEILEKEGIHARVINLHTIKPIDEETIVKAAKETGAIVTAEEHVIQGGMGGAVAEVIVRQFPVPIEMIGIDNSFGRSGTPEELFEFFHLTPIDIAEKARIVLKRKK